MKFKHLYIFIIVFINTVQKASFQFSCPQNQWPCDNGECIAEGIVCDGLAQCADGSDEIAENCVHNVCPTYAFRCTYGACIASIDRCNGEKNCWDNSDELEIECTDDKEAFDKKLQGGCETGEIECEKGICILEELRCDGIVHCTNTKRDESLELCSNIYCPNYGFRCGYGACIAGDARCDGIKDCADGSDEAAMLCNRTRKFPKPCRLPVRENLKFRINKNIAFPHLWIQNGTEVQLECERDHTFSDLNRRNVAICMNGELGQLPNCVPTRTKTTLSTPLPMRGRCRLPVRKNLKFLINKENVPPLTVIQDGLGVEFECEQGHTLIKVGERNMAICENGDLGQIPRCVKYCNNDGIKKLSISPSCFHNDERISCDNELPTGVEAKIHCAIGYKNDNKNSTFTTSLVCQDDSTWSGQLPNCTMTCGSVAAQTTKFSRGGVPVKITEVPWNVAIYYSSEHIYQCSGSIVSPHLVVSAAHCFWNVAINKLFDPNLYIVTAGNDYKEYNSESESVSVQKSNITKIIIQDYYDSVENYRNDVAVLILEKPFNFRNTVRPICLRFLENEQGSINTDTLGIFTGWGINESNKTETLQAVSMKTESYGDCIVSIRKLTAGITSYDLADDKFCLKNNYGATACRGDSGSGFVLKSTTTSFDGRTLEQYFLVGILSHAPSKERDCAKNGVVTLTNVKYMPVDLRRTIEHYKSLL